MPTRSTRHVLALAVALIGVAVSALTLSVELRLEQDAGYVSFCNLGEQMNCDAVLGSRWGRLLDLPLPIWSIAGFLAGAAAAVPGAVLGTVGGFADVLLIGITAGSLGFALVLLWVATALIGTICPLCITMDAVIVAWAIIVFPLVRTVQVPRFGWGALVAGMVGALGGGGYWAVATPAPVETMDDVRQQDSDFVTYYQSLPVDPDPSLTAPGTHVKGAENAPVTIVEFSDFQCPACRQAFVDLRDLAKARDDVRIVFRHYPLDERCNDSVSSGRHPDACLAACAAECAGDQGAFWPYHDRLFENQSTISRDELFRHARELRLDLAAFRGCIDAPETLDRVRRDVSDGTRLRVGSTPTLFINGRRLPGALPRGYYDFAIIIEKDGAATSG